MMSLNDPRQLLGNKRDSLLSATLPYELLEVLCPSLS